MDPGSDAEVIACSFESPAAFGELFDRHATTLFRYFVRRVGPDDADALLGELFRIAFETARASTPTGRGPALALRDRQQPSRPPPERRSPPARRDGPVGELVDAAPDLFADVDARLDASRLWPDVAAAIAALPQGERDTLLLYAWEGMPYEEIAAALDVPVGTVRSRLNRARAGSANSSAGARKNR